jgi:hypothetical protein
MDEWLYILSANAVAQQPTGFRPGARHALLIFLTAPDEDIARQRAKDVALKRHWLAVEVKRIKQLGDPDLIKDESVRSTAELALENGDAIIIFKDEIPHDG